MFAKNFQSNITICVFASVSIHEITSSGSFSQSAHEGGLAYWAIVLLLNNINQPGITPTVPACPYPPWQGDCRKGDLLASRLPDGKI